VVDRRVELHPRIAADPGRLGDHVQQFRGPVVVHRPAVGHRGRRPLRVVHHGLHEPVGGAHRVVRVLVEDRVVGAAGDVEARVVAGLDQGPGLALLDLLAADELHDVGVIGVQNDHLRGAPGLAAALDHAGERVEAAHEGHRARRRSAARQGLGGGTKRRQVAAGARTELEQHPLGLGQAEDRLHRVLDGVDEARRTLRALLDPDVEPHRRVEAGVLVEEDVSQFRVEGLGVRLGREVAALAPPVRDPVGHPGDQLPDARLAPGRPQLAAKVLRHHDVRRRLRPGLRHLDAVLLEHRLALLVGDHGVADVPLDAVEGVDAGLGVAALDRQAGRARGWRRWVGCRRRPRGAGRSGRGHHLPTAG